MDAELSFAAQTLELPKRMHMGHLCGCDIE